MEPTSTPTYPQFRTFNLKQAATFLGVSKYTARELAACGEIPGTKVGRAWRFIEEDLAMYIRSKYANPDALQGVIRRSIDIWHCTSEVDTGGFASATMADEYSEALGLVTG